MPFETATLDGRAVPYLHAGDRHARRTLLLVHGFPLGARMWEEQLHGLGDPAFPANVAGWRILAPSLPGFDGSDRMVRPTVDDYARHVLLFLDHQGVSSAVVAGLSMGGYVTFALLRQASHRVTGLVLADTRSGADSEDAKAGRLKLIETALHDGSATVAGDLLPKLLGPTTLRTRQDVAGVVRGLIESQSREVIADATHALMTRPDSDALLPSIRVPTCVIVGEEDSLTPPVESERMCAAISGATLLRVPGVGHMSNIEAPGAFNSAVRALLGRVEPRP
jgi:pimeloyl-ACP methyl ester carboxylesterase